MDAANFEGSDVGSSVWNKAISRRGGVRTRGGRLPPISMREITHASGSKKVIAPKIPERRKIIKKEIEFPTEQVKIETRDGRPTSRTRPSRVYLQTEGSFLAQGPAARIKKDPSAYQGYSFSPRSSKAAETEGFSNTAFDSDTLKYLLESCEENELYDAVFGITPPYRLPLPKERISKVKGEPEKGKIKKEIAVIKKEIKTEDDKGKIKTEIVEIKKEIKTEIDDETISTEKNFFTKMDLDSKTEMKYLAEEIPSVKGDGMMLLIQFPKHFFAPEAETSETKLKNSDKESDKEPEQMSTILEKVEEGRAGKLQIMKSGRMKLILGSAEFELLGGSRSESYSEVVSITMTDDGGDLTVLGKIDRKVIASPIVDCLLPNVGSCRL